MQDLHELVAKYTIKHQQKIKKICAPLKEHLNISGFTYYTIEEDGSYVLLSTVVDQIDFFYKNKLYLDNPFLVHPALLMSGSLLVPTVADLEQAQCIDELFSLKELFLILKSNGRKMEGALFANPGCKDIGHEIFTQNINLLHKFIPYFKKEAVSLIREIKREGYNLQEAKGKKFWESDPTLPLSIKNVRSCRFLKELFGLSPRELECLELYKLGETAQSTAAILGLSQRTVESYFDNIKNKLGCSSKSELLLY